MPKSRLASTLGNQVTEWMGNEVINPLTVLLSEVANLLTYAFIFFFVLKTWNHLHLVKPVQTQEVLLQRKA